MNSAQDQQRQQSDDENHHEQLDQGEPTPRALKFFSGLLHVHCGPTVPKVARSSLVPKMRSGPALMRMNESLLRGVPSMLAVPGGLRLGFLKYGMAKLALFASHESLICRSPGPRSQRP